MRKICIMRLKKIHQLVKNKIDILLDNEKEEIISNLEKEVNELNVKVEKLNKDMSIVVAAMKEMYLNIEQLMLYSNLNQSIHYNNTILNDDVSESH